MTWEEAATTWAGTKAAEAPEARALVALAIAVEDVIPAGSPDCACAMCAVSAALASVQELFGQR